MRASRLIRKSHRWLSIAFTLLVGANIAVQGNEQVALWVGGATLLPLLLLLVSGLYLFVLPYRKRRVGEEGR
ncbi:MAG: hypothetical protein H6747_16840 [Deltaproteobacteria bacterium]|nr:hypothetical protein [Deltaproteobacteria bacterium]